MDISIRKFWGLSPFVYMISWGRCLVLRRFSKIFQFGLQHEHGLASRCRNSLPSFVLPEPGSASTTLAEHLRESLKFGPSIGRECLVMLFQRKSKDGEFDGPLTALHRVHSPRSARQVEAAAAPRPVTWGELTQRIWSYFLVDTLTLKTEFGKVENDSVVRAAFDANPAIDRSASRNADTKTAWSTDVLLEHLKRLLTQEPRSNIPMGRIHGDLNLTNLLVAQHENLSPEKIFVIDLPFTQRDVPIALDFARLEIALWHEMLPPTENANDPSSLNEFVVARAVVDGVIKEAPPQLSNNARRLIPLVNHVRYRAHEALKPPDSSNYVLGDYFYCLFFTFLSTLGWSKLNLSEREMMVVGAHLTSNLISHLGAYNNKANNHRARPWEKPWEESP